MLRAKGLGRRSCLSTFVRSTVNAGVAWLVVANTAVIVVAEQKVAQGAECRASDP